jgi:nucleotide-binding universal stress UspA family protein
VNASPAAAAAAIEAARIAGALDAELTLLYISTKEEKDFDPRSLAPEGGPRTTVFRRAVVDEHPASEILQIGDDGYDLIVIGAEHKLVHDVTLFGSTTTRVTRHARMPVLTVTRHPAGIPAKTLVAETHAV